MKMRIEVVTVSADGSEHRRQVLAVEREELAMETLGMSLAESKALLESVQDSMIAQQVSEDLERRRTCSHCKRRHTAMSAPLVSKAVSKSSRAVASSRSDATMKRTCRRRSALASCKSTMTSPEGASGN